MIVKDKRHISNYFIMHNKPIQDPSLSWAARGLLAYLISMPDDWKVRMRDLFGRSADGRNLTERAMNELIAAGYVKKEQGENKRKSTVFTVFETPKR
jgi:hypothetical protein